MSKEYSPYDHKGSEYIAQDLIDEKGYIIGREYVGELVLCKDCKHYAGEGMYCAWNLIVMPDDYCSRGERKE